MLDALGCRERYAVLGNHDFMVGPKEVSQALTDHGITLLRNSYMAIERYGARFWLTGVDDPVQGNPLPEATIPDAIRNLPREPVILMCHAPDYADHCCRCPPAMPSHSCSAATPTAARFACL